MRSGRWLTALPVALIGYTYAGYPLLIERAAAGRAKAGRATACSNEPPAQLPSLTVVVAAFDEEQVIEAKIVDLQAQDYPVELLRILVVADGSSDRTPQLARALGVDVLWEAGRGGKSAAVNRGIAASDTELVCLTDANCRLMPGTLRALAAPFADSRVAVVGGAKTVSGVNATARGEGLYWKLEARLKKAESVFGATPGAVGEVCAVRRRYARPIPAGTINDDYHLTCDALVRGYRVLYAPAAVAQEPVSQTAGEEFERRTRVAAGTCQTTLAHLQLCHPRRGPVAWTFGSHRVLRTLVVPPLLPLVLATSALQHRRWSSRLLLAGQLLVYGGAAAATVSSSRLCSAPYAFVITNLATLRGAGRQLSGSQPVAWQRATRPAPADPIPMAEGRS